MSKHNHNYSQYSNKQHNQNKPKVAEAAPKVKMDSMPVISEVMQPKIVQETVETKALTETVEGVVTGCAKLNVRAEPELSAEVVCVLDAMSEIEINVDKSNSEWFHICTAIGIEGYCMRKFVEAHL